MTWAFAVGLSLGAALVVFGRDTRICGRLLLWMHVAMARLRSRIFRRHR